MITIHMTTHRRLASGLLRQAVDSVIGQDFQDFEFVIVDDASVDGTARYLADVALADERVRVVRNERNVNSVAISLGRCLQASDPGRPWVSWMFDDGELLPGALSRLVALASSGQAELVYGVSEVPLSDGRILRIGDAPLSDVRRLVVTSPIVVPNAGMLVRREVFDRVGWYDTSIVLRRSCDWDLARRMIEAGVEIATIPEVVVREYGDLQTDSLRNTFVTTFDIMSRYAAARDAAGVPLDLLSVMTRPVTWIPPGPWTPDELGLMRYMFLEYFLSVAEMDEAFRWAHLLADSLPANLLRDNLLRASTPTASPDERPSAMAAGAFAGVVLGAYRESRGLAAGRPRPTPARTVRTPRMRTDFLEDDELSTLGLAAVGRGVLISRHAILFGTERISVGDHSRIDAFAILSAGSRITLGRHVHISAYVSIMGAAPVEIGDFVGVSLRCSLLSSNDDFSGATMTGPTIPDAFRDVTSAPIVVGPHALLGAASIVLAGVTIGESSSVGAGSLVKGDVPPFTIVAGVPARRIADRRREHRDLAARFVAGEDDRGPAPRR